VFSPHAQNPSSATACRLSVLSAFAQTTCGLILIHGRSEPSIARTPSPKRSPSARERSIAVGPDQQIQPLAGPKNPTGSICREEPRPQAYRYSAHIATGELRSFTSVSLSDAATVSEAVNRVRLAATKLSQASGSPGADGDEGKLADRRYILASDLERSRPTIRSG